MSIVVPPVGGLKTRQVALNRYFLNRPIAVKLYLKIRYYLHCNPSPDANQYIKIYSIGSGRLSGENSHMIRFVPWLLLAQ